MSHSLSEWLDHRRAELPEQLGARLLGPTASAFRVFGEAVTRRTVDRVISALCSDLIAGGDGEIRGALGDLIEELVPRGLGFQDLRGLATALRQELLSGLDAAPELDQAARRRVEDWLFQLVHCSAMYFVAQREEMFQEQATGIEVRRLEAQLVELQEACTEKTELLEMLRQVSIPMAPVFAGVLVVPLVGMLDSQRAQSLTEKLLDAVARTRAKVVILDISGVPVFDSMTAQHVINAAKATKLLGARMFLVGMSPEIARTVVQLGVDLKELTTRGTLEDGLAGALEELQYRIVPISPPR